MVCCGLYTSACVHVGDLPAPAPDQREAARTNTQLGLDYLAQGQFTLAQEKFERALHQNPQLPETHIGLGWLFTQKREYTQAQSYFENALNLDKRHPETLNLYGILLCQTADFERAKKIFEAAAQDSRNSEPARTWSNLGECAKQKQFYTEARQYFHAALNINPAWQPAQAGIASLLNLP